MEALIIKTLANQLTSTSKSLTEPKRLTKWEPRSAFPWDRAQFSVISWSWKVSETREGKRQGESGEGEATGQRREKAMRGKRGDLGRVRAAQGKGDGRAGAGEMEVDLIGGEGEGGGKGNSSGIGVRVHSRR